jgi:hypothetical protein
MNSDGTQMIDLPPTGKRDLPVLADWVELCVLSRDDGLVSQTKVADVLSNAGRIGAPDERPGPGEEEFGAEPDLAPDDPSMHVAEEIWSILRSRRVALGADYPLNVERDLAERRPAAWSDVPCQMAILLLSNLASYDVALQVVQVDDHTYQQLFEKVVQAAGKGLFHGSSARFGVPRDPDWPVAIEARVARLAEDLELIIEDLTGKVSPNDGDRTLDVAARLSFGDDGPGTIFVLLQCATGRNWANKRAEPILAMVEDLIRWDAVLVRGIAIPWWFGDRQEYASWFRKFGKAVILDRPRLLAGKPDDWIQPEYSLLVRQWCEAQLNNLPVLD